MRELDARLLTPYLTGGKETLYIYVVYIVFFFPRENNGIYVFFPQSQGKENNGNFPDFP